MNRCQEKRNLQPKHHKKKRIQRYKEYFEAHYALHKEKKSELRGLIEREKNLVAARTYHEFSTDKNAANAIEKELLRVSKKKLKLNKELFRLYRAAEKERYKARQFPWTWATIDCAERKGLSSRIYRTSDLFYFHPERKQIAGGDIFDSIELVPDDFYYEDSKHIKEKPDHEHYSVDGSNVDVKISNISSFQIESPLYRYFDIWGNLTVNGYIIPEDDYGMLRIVHEVQLVQYRTDKPIGEIEPSEDEPYRIYRSDCGPWYRQYFPQSYGITSIEEKESTLNIRVNDIAVDDKFFIAQYVAVESENSYVSFENASNVGLVKMPHPSVTFRGF